MQEAVLLAKVVGIALVLGIATYYLSGERSRNPAISSIKGVPIVIPVVLVLLVLFTLLLNRTLFGRHVYAVGGNAEAARRAGINVPRIRLLCFVLCSTIAAVAGVLLASRVNSVTPSTGGGETLLYAVGAAVIGGTSLFGGKGRPVDAIIGQMAAGGGTGGEQLQRIHEHYMQEFGLDKPMWQQFLIYCGKVLQGDFGVSTLSSNPVMQDIRRVFPATLELATLGTLIGAGIIGCCAAAFLGLAEPATELVRHPELVRPMVPAEDAFHRAALEQPVRDHGADKRVH